MAPVAGKPPWRQPLGEEDPRVAQTPRTRSRLRQPVQLPDRPLSTLQRRDGHVLDPRAGSLGLSGVLLFRAADHDVTASARVTLAQTPPRCGSRIPEAGTWRLGGSRGVRNCRGSGMV